MGVKSFITLAPGRALTFIVENLAQVWSCSLKFVQLATQLFHTYGQVACQCR
jgi:hypothetical protein